MAALAYSAEEMAEALGVSRSTLYRQVRSGMDIPALHIGKRVVFPKAAVHRWLEEQAADPKAVAS